MKCPICDRTTLVFTARDTNYYDKIIYCINPHFDIYLKNNWWFAAGYSLVFDYKNILLKVEAPVNNNNNITILSKLETANYNWKKIFSIGHHALPVNEDFLPEFEKLKEKIIKYIILI